MVYANLKFKPYLLLLILVFGGCSEDVEKAGNWRLAKVIINNPGDTYSYDKEFVYDAKGNLIRAGETTFIYNTDGSIAKSIKYFLWGIFGDQCKSTEYSYQYENNLVVTFSRNPVNSNAPAGCPTFDGPGVRQTFYLSNDRLEWMVEDLRYQKDSTVYMYQNENIQLFKVYRKNSASEGYYLFHSYTFVDYDNNPNPFRFYKPLLTGFSAIQLFSVNNPIRITTSYPSGFKEVTQYIYSYNSEAYPLTRSDGVALEQYEYIIK